MKSLWLEAKIGAIPDALVEVIETNLQERISKSSGGSQLQFSGKYPNHHDGESEAACPVRNSLGNTAGVRIPAIKAFFRKRYP